MNDTNLRKIAESMSDLANSINRYTTLQTYAELYKCGLISENEFKSGLKGIATPSFTFKVTKIGKVATDDAVIGKADSK